MSLRRAGRMHHLRVGTDHARKRVLAFADDHQVTVAELTTGEVLSLHLIEPQDLLAQPKHKSPAAGRALKSETYVATHVRHYVPTHHTEPTGGLEPPTPSLRVKCSTS